jgi:hypothetical protein
VLVVAVVGMQVEEEQEDCYKAHKQCKLELVIK